jgi:AcrR family transcriptional regulator
MAQKGITKEKIYQAAVELIVEKGYDNFSLRELASRLGVKPASLYCHVKNAKAISSAVGEKAIRDLSVVLEKAIDKKNDDEAFFDFAASYRKFAHDNPELYRAIMALPDASDEELKRDEQRTILPLRKLVERYVSSEENVINYQRYIRSAIHGFIMLEASGFMRNKAYPAEESYNMLVESCLAGIKNAKLAEIPGGGR